jgi:hypothetical protein
LKLPQENVRKTLEDVGTGGDFLNRILVAQEIGTSFDNWAFVKLKSICISKKTIARIKRQPTECEKIFASYSSKD